MQLKRYAQLTVALAAFAVVVSISIASCGPKGKINAVPEASGAVHVLQITRGVNDVTTAVVAANKNNNLTDPQTAAILNVNKQVLDSITALVQEDPANMDRPTVVDGKIREVIKNALEALPPDVRTALTPWIARITALLGGVQP